MPVQLRIGPKLMLALAGLLAATVMVSGVAVAGLGAVDARAQELYRHNILTTLAIAGGPSARWPAPFRARSRARAWRCASGAATGAAGTGRRC